MTMLVVGSKQWNFILAIISNTHIIINTSAMHSTWSELDSTTELCSTEEMRRAAINDILTDRGCSNYTCGKYSHISRVIQ